MKTHQKSPKVRKTWGELSPVERRIESHKRYQRRNKWRKIDTE